MDKNIILPNSKERALGWQYFLFQVVFLAWVIGHVLSFLRLPISRAGINLVYFSLNFAVAILGFLRFWRETFSGILRSFPKILGFTFLGFAVFRMLSVAMSLLILSIDPEFANVNDQSIAELSREDFWAMALGTVVLAPVAEEVFNRGCIFGGLLGRSKAAAYLVSTVIFSIIHINGYIGAVPPLTLFLCFLQYLPAGLCLAAAYHFSGSILTPILIHSAVNAIGILVMR